MSTSQTKLHSTQKIQLKKLREENKQLQKELRRKEKALAEARVAEGTGQSSDDIIKPEDVVWDEKE